MRHLRRSVFSLLAVLLLGFPAAALAQMSLPAMPAYGGKIQMGNLKVIPGFELQGEYDDNIYKANGKNELEEKVKSDWITHVRPGILFDYALPERGYARLGYLGDWAFYNSNSDNNWWRHEVLADVKYEAPAGAILGVFNQFVNSQDPYGDASQYKIGKTTQRWTNDLRSKLGYDFFGNLRGLVYYNFYKQDYKERRDYSQNFNDNEVGAGVEARFLPKTWGFLRYHYGIRDYGTDVATKDYNSNSKWHRVNAGLTWDADAKLQGELNLGYQWKTYDNKYTAPGGAVREDKNTWIAATSVTWLATATTALNLNVSRALRDTGADTNEYFEDTGIGVQLQQQFLRKFLLKLGASYSKNEYNQPAADKRKDDNYLANAGIDWKLQEWLTLGAGYHYNKKSSNYDANSFTDNRFLANVTLTY